MLESTVENIEETTGCEGTGTEIVRKLGRVRLRKKAEVGNMEWDSSFGNKSSCLEGLKRCRNCRKGWRGVDTIAVGQMAWDEEE